MTLWGPTHLMLIGGAAMTLVGIAILSVEGLRANAAGESQIAELAHTKMARAVALTGGLMLGLSTFQAEFDFGVPQFQLIFQPLMLMVAAGVGLVLARIYAGPGAALGAAGFFILLRGGLAIVVGPVLGQTMPHFPLYIAEAVVVEAVALFVSTRKPLRFGLVSGIGIGTDRPRRRVGLVAALDAAPLARLCLPRSRDRRLRRRDRRRHDRRLDRHPPLSRPDAAIAAAAPGCTLQRRSAGGARRLRPLHADPGRQPAPRSPCATSTTVRAAKSRPPSA